MPKTAAPARILRSRGTDFNVREENDELVISGYFVVFDQPYYVDEFSEEIIARGAFDQAEQDDVRALIDHLPHLVLGRTTAGTLNYSIDDTGIFCEIRINEKDQDALNLYARVQRGDVNQASFGFDEDFSAGEWTELPDGRARWTVRRITKLWEFSVCTFPAYEQTFVEARSRDLAAWRSSREKAAAEARKAKLRRHFKHPKI